MKKTLLLTLSLLCLTIAYSQSNLFVDASASDNSGAGTSWSTAKKTISAALEAAGSNTTIFVKVGSYNCSAEIIIPNGVTLIGGFASSSTGTDTTHRLYPGSNANWTIGSLCTIINAGNSHRVATVNAGGKLIGCVLTNGNTSQNGGAVYINGGHVQHCVLKDSKAIDETDQLAKGGGAYIANNGTLINSVVTGNIANNGAGVAGSDGTLTNNTISNNFIRRNCGTVTDYDGNVYSTVVIGEQCWMRENLRTTHFAIGTAIPNGVTSTYYNPYYYYPNNTSSNVSTYGLLYNWYAATNGTASSGSTYVQGVCPMGWHIPSQTEWQQLSTYVNSQMAYRCDATSGYIGKSLSSTTGWRSYITNACCIGDHPDKNNATGFDAKPAGYFSGSFGDFSNYACFWSSSRYNSNYYYYYLQYSSYNLSSSYDSAPSARSVRCLKD